MAPRYGWKLQGGYEVMALTSRPNRGRVVGKLVPCGQIAKVGSKWLAFDMQRQLLGTFDRQQDAGSAVYENAIEEVN